MRKNQLRWLGLLGLILIAIPLIAQGQVLPPCTATGNCGFCDFTQGFVNIVRWVLGVLGGSALFLLVWHGFAWITAGGNKEKVETGRKGLVHTVIGLAIIIGSWFIVNAVLTVLLTPPGQSVVQTLFSGSNPWYQFCNVPNSGTEFCKQGWGEGVPCGGNKFCLKRKVGSAANLEMTCGNTSADGSKSFDNPCHYWAEYPNIPPIPPRLEYQDYRCVEGASNCIGGKILGAQYCTQNKVCCEPKPGAAFEEFTSQLQGLPAP
jgi:hypothetical protein